MKYCRTSSPPRILQANATVVPGDTTVLVYSAWRHIAKRRLYCENQQVVWDAKLVPDIYIYKMVINGRDGWSGKIVVSK